MPLKSSRSNELQESPRRGVISRSISHDDEIILGSENAWADLGYPDAQERKVKADLAFEIRRRFDDLQITQSGAAKKLGIRQPKVSQSVNFRTSGYSVDRLAALPIQLGATVEMHISYKS